MACQMQSEMKDICSGPSNICFLSAPGPFLRTITMVLICGWFLTSCLSTPDKNPEKSILESLKNASGLSDADFDTTLNGQHVGLYWIQNDSILAAFTNYGARIIGLWVPNKETEGPDPLSGWTDVVVGM